MAIELRQSLKLSQQLVITPQLQQAIKLLQLSRTELVDMVQNELLENPVLEEMSTAEQEEVPPEMEKEIESEAAPDKSHEAQEELHKDGDLKEPKEFDWENYIGTYNAPGEEARSFSPDDLPNYENMTTRPNTLRDHLEWQLKMNAVTEKEEELGYLLLGYLDDNGYLTQSLDEIAEANSVTVDDLDDSLSVIQDFDPAGVGARDLKECLKLQCRYYTGIEKAQLIDIIENYLPLVEKRDYPAIARKTKLPLKKIIQLAQYISEMEPKPGRPFGASDTQYITPDVYVMKVGNDFAIVLNEDGLPRLQVSRYYKGMLSGEASGDKAKDYVQEKLKSALWLIKSIHQRQRTLYRVSKCIVKFQREFLERGVEALKPMILKDVAESIGVHESTVSRATSNKYMHTPQGIFELKYFFNNGLASSSGQQDVASESVKEKIRAIVAAEDPKDPLSDITIVDMLKKSNIEIARRTVAKYREMLNILPSSKRKRLF
ncbi:RNA polymerase factor sigma-54 [bacterium]|nr:RNA polymerase factor sigma-54 [bacterium]